MLNLCDIVVAILKMATGRNCSMLGINSGHHNLPTYEMSLKSDNVEFVRYCGRLLLNDNGEIVQQYYGRNNGEIVQQYYGRNKKEEKNMVLNKFYLWRKQEYHRPAASH